MRVVASLAALVLSAKCGGSGAGQADTGSTDAGRSDTWTAVDGNWCESLCGRLKSCIANVDQAACLSNCAASTQFTEAAGAVIAGCANSVDCSANFTSLGAIDACIEAHWPSGATPGAEQACEDFATAAAQCEQTLGWHDGIRAYCMKWLAPALSDALLAALAECAPSCNDALYCVGQAFTGFPVLVSLATDYMHSAARERAESLLDCQGANDHSCCTPDDHCGRAADGECLCPGCAWDAQECFAN